MRRLLPLLVLALAAGCGRPARIVSSLLPTGFVGVDPGSYVWRGMSGDGVLVGLRSFENTPQSTLDFWTKVVRNELESARGYVHEASEMVGAAQSMLFAADGESYYLAITVTPGRIWVFEAGGRRDDVTRELPALKAFVEKLKLS
jgi:hypothetical protein